MSGWIDRHKGWLKDHTRRQEDRDREERSEESGKEEYDNNNYVLFIPTRCPKCESKNTKIYKTNVPVRYHKCKLCGHKFKSYEKNGV